MRLTSASRMDSEEGRASLLNALLDQVLEGPSLQMTRSLSDLPQRELPPGTWAGVFLLYNAHCVSSQTRPASKALFYSTIKAWRKVLKFRRRSQHSVCHECERLKSEMRHAASFLQDARAADSLLGHLSLTWRCRQVYWGMRERSRQADSDVLTLIIDGFDKSKLALPRWPRGRPPKGGAFDRVNRPTLQLSAALVHGWGCLVFLAEEHQSCGGSYTWDSVFIAIEEVWRRCGQSGRRLPRACLVTD